MKKARGRPERPWTGFEFPNGAVVVERGPRIRSGTYLALGWILRCPCGASFPRSSNALRVAEREGLSPKCSACEELRWREGAARMTEARRACAG